ncbi:MAG: hypothetical protein F6K21_03320 [Symploca sp. SIO2D2]|nr:hypothetical protein [Symploca sp. SIO2D2]NER22896.1 hypothetical protein [Symploca sp. SIO1C2]
MAEHFSTIADRRKCGTLDALLMMRDPADGAISATTSTTAIEFNSRKVDHFRGILTHQAIASVTPGTAEWTVAIEVSDTQTGTFTEIASQILGADATEYEFGFTGAEIEDQAPTAAWMRLTATKAGGVGDLSFGGWLTP